MLDPQATWTAAIQSLPPNPVEPAAMLLLATTIGGLTDMVQAGATGTPGILTFNAPVMASAISSLPPTALPTWITSMVNAWSSAVTASIITPGTVTSPVWTVSAVDTLTLPSAAATLGAAIAAGAAILTSELTALSVIFSNPSSTTAQLLQGPQMTAKAFRDATLAFQFTCIGLTLVGVTPTPTPLVLPAE